MGLLFDDEFMGDSEQVAGLRALLRRRTAEALEHQYGLEPSVAESAAELIAEGAAGLIAVAFGEGVAVGKMRQKVAEAERLGQRLRADHARLIAGRKAAPT